MMNIDLNVPDHIRQVIEPHIKKRLEELAKEILTTRIANLFAQFAPRRPPGRPKVSEARKHESALGKDLLTIFDNLKHVFPKEYETLYGAMEAELRTAISRGDMETLQRFNKTKPWLTGGKAE